MENKDGKICAIFVREVGWVYPAEVDRYIYSAEEVVNEYIYNWYWCEDTKYLGSEVIAIRYSSQGRGD